MYRYFGSIMFINGMLKIFTFFLLVLLSFITISCSRKSVEALMMEEPQFEYAIPVKKSEDFSQWLITHDSILADITSLNLHTEKDSYWIIWGHADGFDEINLRPSFPDDNRIPYLSNDIQKLSQLNRLRMSTIGLERLPEGLAALDKLEELDISFNPLSIPDSWEIFAQMKSLRILKVYGCTFDRKDIDRLERELGLKVRYTYDQFMEENPPQEMEGEVPDGRPEPVKDIIAHLRNYYPFGDPTAFESFDGYADYWKIVDRKRDHLQLTGKIPDWHEFTEAFEKEEPIHKIDFSFVIVPEYTVRYVLERNEYPHWTEEKCLWISVSLLTPYYTAFYEISNTYTRFGGKEIYGSRSDKPRKLIVFGEEKANQVELQQLVKVKNLLAEYFSEHQFIPHHYLFDYKIPAKDAVPIGEFGISPDEEFIYLKEKEYALRKFTMRSYKVFDRTDGLEVFK